MLTGKAACFLGPGKPFEIREFPVPDPALGCIVVKTALTNICGSDLHQWRGTFDLAAAGRPYPQILGHELTGEIFRLAPDVTNDSSGAPVAIGDQIVFRYYYPCGHCRYCAKGIGRACLRPRTYLNKPCDVPPYFQGGYAEYYYLHAGATFFKVPPGLSSRMVAGANCALSQAICGLEVANLGIGETVVVQGSGGLGAYAIAVARERGAAEVIAIEGVADRIELARKFGANEIVDLRELPRPEDRIAEVMRLTDGWGADLVCDFVGHPAAVAEGLRMVAPTGRYLEVGNIVLGSTTGIDPAWFTVGNRSLLGVMYYEPRHLQASLRLIARTLNRYPWSDAVSHEFPLERINEAFALASSKSGCRVAIRLSA